MSVMTVNGVIAKEALGITAPHEHALIDIRNQYPGHEAGKYQKVTPEYYELLMSDPYGLRDNLVLEDEALAIREVGLFARAGGRTFVDVTLREIGRDPLFLRRLSKETGVHVVAACGAYTADAHPKEISAMSAEELAAQMVLELTAGIDGTDVRAGIIGEIGTSRDLHPREVKVLRSATLAHKETGAPVMVHLCPWAKHGNAVLDILDDVPPENICLCHTDVLLDLSDMEQLLKRGIYLEFDNFGKEFTSGSAYGRFPSDEERMDVLYKLIDRGFLKQLLVSCDICLKNLLTVHGGPGYGHFLTKMAQKLRKDRTDAEEILQALLVENPADYLDNPRLKVDL